MPNYGVDRGSGAGGTGAGTQVGTTEIEDLAVTAAKLAASAVETAKINDLAVTTAKIADSNVTTAKIADSNVTTAKIADAAITSLAAGFSIVNGYLDWSVASSILTVAIKTDAGTDPSASDPVYITFRSVTPGTGSMTTRKLTAATSITIPDTATLGTANSTAFRLWVVAFDDGGTVRLGLINCLSGLNIYPLAGWGIASSTQDGTGSDSAHVFYSDGAAVTSKAYATLGFASWESGLATAGTWSAAPTRAQLFGPGVRLPGQVIQTQTNNVTTGSSGTTTIPTDDTIPQNTEGTELFTQVITPTSAANLLDINTKVQLACSATAYVVIALFQDTGADAIAAQGDRAAVANHFSNDSLRLTKLAGTTSATTFKVRYGPGTAATVTINGFSGGTRGFGGVCYSRLQVMEIMA